MKQRYPNIKTLALPSGPAFALFAGLLMWSSTGNMEAAITLGVTFWVVVWWIFEPIPIPATSLLPMALLPMLGVLSAKELGAAYGSPLVLLMMGGFLLATALERSGAHRRIALYMVRLFGGNSSRRLVFGFMLASAFLSMWISNTSTTLMLLPVALAVLEKSEDNDLAAPLLLGIAYAASIGGIATPIGTPPNLVFMGVYTEIMGAPISFGQWMMWALPIALVLLPIAAFWITRNIDHEGQIELPEVGNWTTSERRVLTVFVITALLWVTRTGPFGGWSSWLNVPYTNDAIVAFLAVIALFVIPSGEKTADGTPIRLMDWETAEKIPWGMLLLFGAGITIATAFTNSGLSTSIGASLEQLSNLPILLMIGVLCLAVTFLTEVTSNTATTTLLMPILGAAAVGASIDPILFMIPAAMSASCAFMLPVATPPNVVTFATGKFSIQTMVREGVAMNLFGVIVISLGCYLLLT
ncbi:MAG: SLC13/DASS family transporter [Gammaproteobacteria bacterium]|jgi:sodium-dependent dicarboxylate transporter 2/3/5|nr:SLC13/DASS family transporter [Gammaproteobacteria bacterium]MDA7723310.1 SLC13 family permease [Pseudomonadales bacterium]MDB9797396.1 SLC13 family permease [Pseudomonadales bacterium]MDC1322729.1 SLC13 family permease [Pseudomonadales bacterium]MDC3409501.1 SLC13 family permease [bacterium]|tara:strand:- start:629 stop:2035 length:1407 start_codon:yes stop_codon:yes gene_type:complete